MNRISISTLVLLILSVVFISCNKEKSYERKIVGTWKIIKEVEGCSDGIKREENVDECYGKSTFSFLENGTFTSLQFSTDNSASICESANFVGTWEILDEKLTIELEGFGKETYTYLEVKRKSLKIGEYDENGNCDGSYYYNEFEKE